MDGKSTSSLPKFKIKFGQGRSRSIIPVDTIIEKSLNFNSTLKDAMDAHQKDQKSKLNDSTHNASISMVDQ